MVSTSAVIRLYILALLCRGIFGIGEPTKSIVYNAYFNVKSTQISRCDNGMKAGMASALDIDIENLIKAFSEKNDTNKTPSNEVSGSTAAVTSTNSTKAKPDPGKPKTRLLEEIVTEDRNHSLSEIHDSTENVSQIEKFLNMLQNAKGVYRVPQPEEEPSKVSTMTSPGREANQQFANILGSVVEFFLKKMVEESKQKKELDNKRRLQSSSGLAKIINENLLGISHFLSPTFLRALSSTFGSREKNQMLGFRGDPDITLAEVLCRATSSAFNIESGKSIHLCALEEAFFTLVQCQDLFTSNCTEFKEYNPSKSHDPVKTCDKLTSDGIYTTIDWSKSFRFDFVDVRVGDPPTTPDKLSEYYFSFEGGYYYQMFRAIHTLHDLALAYISCNRTRVENTQYIPRWNDLHFTYYQSINSSNQISHTTPIAVLLEPDDATTNHTENCQFVIIVRPTGFPNEWGTNFDFKQVPFAAPGVQMHSGFSGLANGIFLNMLQAFEEYSLFQRCENIELITTGHSLGASVSQAIALLFKVTFPKMHVTSVNFAPSNVFNQYGSDLSARLINLRNVVVDLDPITHIPCPMSLYPDGVISCDDYGTHKKTWQKYADIRGKLEIPLRDRVHEYNITNQWFKLDIEKLELVINFPIGFQMAVSHTCAYYCQFARYCTRGKTDFLTCSSCKGQIKPIIISLPKMM